MPELTFLLALVCLGCPAICQSPMKTHREKLCKLLDENSIESPEQTHKYSPLPLPCLLNEAFKLKICPQFVKCCSEFVIKCREGCVCVGGGRDGCVVGRSSLRCGCLTDISYASSRICCMHHALDLVRFARKGVKTKEFLQFPS